MQVHHNEKIIQPSEYVLALRQRRQRLGITQTTIADYLGISSMLLSHFERGTRIPKVDMLEKWADSLNAEVIITIKEK